MWGVLTQCWATKPSFFFLCLSLSIISLTLSWGFCILHVGHRVLYTRRKRSKKESGNKQDIGIWRIFVENRQLGSFLFLLHSNLFVRTRYIKWLVSDVLKLFQILISANLNFFDLFRTLKIGNKLIYTL